MSKIEVNQISSQCGSTLTIGQSGDTIQLACGATQSGFGRSGSVNWDTTAKTASFTAVSGNGYFVNTTSGAVTVTLPASPSAGDIVAVADYAATAATNNITIARNGSNINGAASDLTISENNSAITLVYVDGTQGWKGTQTSNLNDIQLQPLYIAATGGTITCCGDYKIHTFTGPGNFCVSCAGNAAGSTTVDYLVIAGGGGGGSEYAGGGGAGGYRFSDGTASGCYTAGPSPLGASGLPVSIQSYPITVGGGGAAGTGAGGPNPLVTGGCRGSNSVFSTITSTGGGGGGAHAISATCKQNGLPGGSGGGGGNIQCTAGAGLGGSGNTPPVSPPQGNDGGDGYHDAAIYANGAGGGGASAAGGSIPTSAPTFTDPASGAGGAGLTSCITASPVTRGGGGGGGDHPNRSPGAPGGSGGGGAGGTAGTGTNGTANTGGGAGGGGGGTPTSNGGAGGSGIVIIRYKYQ
jgi:hypothetical protein